MFLRLSQLLFLGVTNVIFVTVVSKTTDISFTVAYNGMDNCEPWYYPGWKCDPYCKIYFQPVDGESEFMNETATMSESNTGKFPGEFKCTSSNEKDMLYFKFYDNDWPWPSDDYYGYCNFTVKEIVEGKPAIKNIESKMTSNSQAIVNCTSATKPKSSDLE